MNEINRFIDISNEIGSDVAFVQAGGGNTSVKLSTKEMLIKSSGIYLKDMTPNSGFCNVNFPEIKEYHYNLIDDEEKYSQKLNESVIKGVGRPSMETGFHALIPHKYVIHSHPVYLNVLLCSNKGEDMTSSIFNYFNWVSTTAPGKYLSLEILRILDQKKQLKDVEIFFLENHGLIISSNDPGLCLRQHQSISREVFKSLNLEKFNFTQFCNMEDEFDGMALFPDQAVFSSLESSNSIAFRENFAAANYILDQIKKLNLKPKFLDKDLINYLQGMPSEKYRSSLN